MKIRAYHTDSVESAIRQARLELGDEAMLLDSKETAPAERHRGLYEVRFGFGGGAAPARAPSAGPGGKLSELSEGIEEIRRMLYSHTQTCYLPVGEFFSQPELAGLYRDLVANDVTPEMAARLLAPLTAAAGTGVSREKLDQALVEQVRTLLPAGSETGQGATNPRVLALVGPSGAGKTATLAKLAAQLGVAHGLSVHLLSADVYRVAAVEQLQTYAGILGAGWTAVEEAEQLAAALDAFERDSASGFAQRCLSSQRSLSSQSSVSNQSSGSNPAGHFSRPVTSSPGRAPELILVDTPGYGLAELKRAAELAELLSSRSQIEVHLVVSASTKPRDLRQITDNYRIFGPRKLLFTKLDETLSFGPLLEEPIRTGWPISFLGVGQRIPEDLIAANASALADLIVKRGARPGGC